MIPFLWTLLWVALVGLMVVAGVAVRRRIRQDVGRRRPEVDDEAVRAILRTGVLATDEDEPLDIGEIDDEERRFWSERSEDPDEW